MEKTTVYNSPGPVASHYLLSKAFINGIRGPFGSGKSTASIMKLVKNCQEANRQTDGWIRRRTGIIRNTYPELKTTTIKTWHDWVPRNYGTWRDSGPPAHMIRDPKHKIEWEVWFIALDSEADVAKLLSMDLSDAWVNEAREVPKAIIDGLMARVGRFPREEEGGCQNAQILLDTNPPDTDHWWYTLAEKDTSTERNRQMLESLQAAEAELRGMGVLDAQQPLMTFWSQPGGRSPQVENLHNLRPGYYQFTMAGKGEQWIKVYVDGEYGFVQDGKPVHPGYRDSLHCRPVQFTAGRPLVVGLDFGLTPAAAFIQVGITGQVRCLGELCATDMGIKRFGPLLARHIREKFPAVAQLDVYGDPAGDNRDNSEDTAFSLLTAAGITARRAPSQEPTLRREALDGPLGRLIDGEPGFLLDPSAVMIRRGLAGKFRYRRVQVLGDARYEDKPEKNEFSHPCEALEYGVLGGGENPRALPRGSGPAGVIHVKNDWPVFGKRQRGR